MATNDGSQTSDDSAESAQTPEIPLNRAQRRALAMGKKGASNGQRSGTMRGPDHRGGTVRGADVPPPAQHTRGSNRGK
jgi:hypothetical protein